MLDGSSCEATHVPQLNTSTELVATFVVDGLIASQDARTERWLEVIETYAVPFDPEWRGTVEQASSDNIGSFFPKDVNSLAQREAKESERTRKTQDLLNDLRATASKEMPLTIMRLWDGITKTELCLSFGKSQRGIVNRLKSGKPIRTKLAVAASGEDLQAGRTTIRQILPSATVPSDFAPAAEATWNTWDRMFGELDASQLARVISIRPTKDPAPGSGVLSLRLDLQICDVQLDPRFPWFAEFRLFELAKDGSRNREVPFDGPNCVVAISADQSSARVTRQLNPKINLVDLRVATGQIEVKSPQPWGYEAEIVRWFGVAPKSMLKPSSKPGKVIGGDESSGSDASPPSAAEDDPLAVPTTPEIPDDS
jgi:hypothetical protein